MAELTEAQKKQAAEMVSVDASWALQHPESVVKIGDYYYRPPISATELAAGGHDTAAISAAKLQEPKAVADAGDAAAQFVAAAGAVTPSQDDTEIRKAAARLTERYGYVASVAWSPDKGYYVTPYATQEDTGEEMAAARVVPVTPPRLEIYGVIPSTQEILVRTESGEVVPIPATKKQMAQAEAYVASETSADVLQSQIKAAERAAQSLQKLSSYRTVATAPGPEGEDVESYDLIAALRDGAISPASAASVFGQEAVDAAQQSIADLERLEQTHLKLGDAYVPLESEKDTEGNITRAGWNDLDEKYQTIGLRQGYDAMVAAIDRDVQAAEQDRVVLQELQDKGYGSESSGYDVARALATGGLSQDVAERLFGKDTVAQSIAENARIKEQEAALAKLAPFEGRLTDQPVDPAESPVTAYDIAKFLRQKDADESVLTVAGFTPAEVGLAKDYNYRYLGIGAPQHVPRKTFVTGYFKDKSWDLTPHFGAMTDAEFREYNEKLVEANAAYNSVYAPPMTLEEYSRNYFAEKGWEYRVHRGDTAKAKEWDDHQTETARSYIQKFGSAPVIEQGLGKAVDLVPFVAVARRAKGMSPAAIGLNLAIDAVFLALLAPGVTAKVAATPFRLLGRVYKEIRLAGAEARNPEAVARVAAWNETVGALNKSVMALREGVARAEAKQIKGAADRLYRVAQNMKTQGIAGAEQIAARAEAISTNATYIAASNKSLSKVPVLGERLVRVSQDAERKLLVKQAKDMVRVAKDSFAKAGRERGSVGAREVSQKEAADIVKRAREYEEFIKRKAAEKLEQVEKMRVKVIPSEETGLTAQEFESFVARRVTPGYTTVRGVKIPNKELSHEEFKTALRDLRFAQQAEQEAAVPAKLLPSETMAQRQAAEAAAKKEIERAAAQARYAEMRKAEEKWLRAYMARERELAESKARDLAAMRAAEERLRQRALVRLAKIHTNAILKAAAQALNRTKSMGASKVLLNLDSKELLAAAVVASPIIMAQVLAKADTKTLAKTKTQLGTALSQALRQGNLAEAKTLALARVQTEAETSAKALVQAMIRTQAKTETKAETKTETVGLVEPALKPAEGVTQKPALKPATKPALKPALAPAPAPAPVVQRVGVTPEPVKPLRPPRPPPRPPKPPREPKMPRGIHIPLPERGVVAEGAVPVTAGALAWRQGMFWKYIPPPWGQQKPITLGRGQIPRGAKTGGRTPKETIQLIGRPRAPAPTEVSVDLGVVDIVIRDGREIDFKGRGEETDIGTRLPETTRGMDVSDESGGGGRSGGRVVVAARRARTKPRRRQRRADDFSDLTSLRGMRW